MVASFMRPSPCDLAAVVCLLKCCVLHCAVWNDLSKFHEIYFTFASNVGLTDHLGHCFDGGLLNQAHHRVLQRSFADDHILAWWTCRHLEACRLHDSYGPLTFVPRRIPVPASLPTINTDIPNSNRPRPILCSPLTNNCADQLSSRCSPQLAAIIASVADVSIIVFSVVPSPTAVRCAAHSTLLTITHIIFAAYPQAASRSRDGLHLSCRSVHLRQVKLAPSREP